ncbi:MAG: phytoene desaturase family protein [Promethearchaeota archaeon]
MENFDVIILGAGPNGLTAGAYLAKAGLKVLLLEKRHEAGGGLATEEVTMPGFLHNTHAIYMPMIDYVPVIHDLGLTPDKIQWIHPEPVMTMHFSDGRALSIYPDDKRTSESISQFSEKDAKAYLETAPRFAELTDAFLAPATYKAPDQAIEALVKLQSHEIGREINAYTERTPKDIVFDLFENDRVRALFLYAACMWGLDWDLEGVSYLVPLLINRASHYRLTRGGSHRFAHWIYKTMYKFGGRVWTSQRIERIILDEGRACGVELDDGTVLKSKIVASSLDPYQTFLKYIGEEHLEPEFATRLKDYQWEAHSHFTYHMALDDAPRFALADTYPDLEKSLIHVMGFDTPQDLMDHWGRSKQGKLEKGGFNCCFYSLLDPSIAPQGKHIGLISQHAPFSIHGADEDAWYRERIGHAQRCLDVLEQYVPNIREIILRDYISTPLDIENKFWDMGRGSIKQGAYLPLQMGYFRPNEYCSQYATPVEGLYLCGASVFPGGLITLGSGYNAANRIVEDLGIEKCWPKLESVARAEEIGLL